MDQAQINQLSNMLADLHGLVNKLQPLEFRDAAALHALMGGQLQGAPVNIPNVLNAYKAADMMAAAREVPRPIDEVTIAEVNTFARIWEDQKKARGPRVDPGPPVTLAKPGGGA